MDTLNDLKVCGQYLKIPRARFGNRKVEALKLTVDLLKETSDYWIAYLFTGVKNKEFFEVKPNVNRGWFEKLVLPLRYYFKSDLGGIIKKIPESEKVVALVMVECNLRNSNNIVFKLYLVPEGKTMKQLLADYDTALNLNTTTNELSFV